MECAGGQGAECCSPAALKNARIDRMRKHLRIFILPLACLITLFAGLVIHAVTHAQNPPPAAKEEARPKISSDDKSAIALLQRDQARIQAQMKAMEAQY